ncbi:ATP-binding protein [Streptomyces sp. ODS05-4]|uniref:ATP-binding protein n=1 Tax=Streptomyces sp. ODS05-4 TaxID=2944939 RepID=UPI00210E8F81|nr:ATP-binding protein [Streptomyces sp. ODS05-4]
MAATAAAPDGGGGAPAPSGDTGRVGDAGVVGRTRRTLVDLLHAVGPSDQDPDPRLEERFDVALLVTSELVTNACRHAGGPDHVGLLVEDGALTVTVRDPSERRPCPRRGDERGEAGGFGLALVDALAERWGVIGGRGRGKTVYAVVRLS